MDIGQEIGLNAIDTKHILNGAMKSGLFFCLTECYELLAGINGD